MRVDKYLWAVRVFKTRSLASEAIKTNKVLIDGKAMKPSRDVKPGDVLEVKKMPIWRKYEVKALLKNRVSAKIVGDYVKDVTPADELERLETIKKAGFLQRSKGMGRPTKRERREIDKMLDQPDEFFNDEEWPARFDDDGDKD